MREIQAKVLLSPVKQPDPWFGLRYSMNLYRGCQHQCIYCDSRSECYQIENFDGEVLVKVNAVELLGRELPRKRLKGTIGTGSMNDPYMPLEKQYNLTGRALQVIAANRFPVHIITKSDLVLRDLYTLRQIAGTYAAVSFTVTTADDALARIVEPAAPLPSARFRAMRVLAEAGILTGVVLMPILPFLEDNPENLRAIIEQAHASSAAYIIPAFGMTLRDRQRAHYYAKLDKHFPGLRPRYERAFGEQYHAPAQNAAQLAQLLDDLCAHYGLATRMPFYQPEAPAQMPLL